MTGRQPRSCPRWAIRRRLPPLTFVVDYDGTICLTQVTDVLMEVYAETDEWLAPRRAVHAQRDRLARGAGPARRLAAGASASRWWPPRPPSRTTLTFSASSALSAGSELEIEVVSDGYGFYVEPALASLGVTGVPIVTAETSWATGRPEITFPAGHPDCLVCGTCKRERVLVHQARGRHVVLVGDGPSDRFAAAHADTIFAKPPLSGLVRRGRLAVHRLVDLRRRDRLARGGRRANPSTLAPRERPRPGLRTRGLGSRSDASARSHGLTARPGRPSRTGS